MSNIVTDKVKLYFNETKANKFYVLLYFVCLLLFSVSMLDVSNFLHPKFIALIIVILFVFGVFLINYHTLHDTELYKTVFILILIVGLFIAFTTPIFDAPDEEEHFERVILTSQGDFFPEYFNHHFNSEQIIFDLRDNGSGTIFSSSLEHQPINSSYNTYPSAFQQNPFFGYLASGLGLLIASLISLNTLGTLWLTRFLNVLVYATCVAIAVKKAPYGKILIVAMACIPLALYQSSVVSIDHLISGLSLVLIAYLLYMFKYPEKINKKDILIYSLICIAIGLCKVTCFIFILFLLFLPLRKLENKKLALYGIISIILTVGIALLWVKLFATPNNLHSWRLEYMLTNNVNQTAQLDYMLNNIDLTFPMVVTHLFNGIFGYTYLLSSISYPRLEYVVASPLVAILYGFFLAFLIFFYPIKEKLSSNLRLSGLLLILLFAVGTVLTFYLTWSPVGTLDILGVQARYFLPIFFLMPFIFNISSKIQIKRNIDNWLLVLIISFAVYAVLLNLFFYY